MIEQMAKKESKYNINAILNKLSNILTSEYMNYIHIFHQQMNKDQKSYLTIQSYLQDILTVMQFFHDQNELPTELFAWKSFLKHRYQTCMPQSTKKLIMSIKCFALNVITNQSNTNASQIKQLLETLNKIELPKLPKLKPKPLNKEHIQQMLNYTNPNPILEARNQALIYLLYGSGMRISEALSLQVNQFANINNTNIINHKISVLGKGNKWRDIPILDNILEKIQKYLSVRNANNNTLFLDQHNKPLTRQQAYKIITQLKQQFNLPDHTSPHTLRHSFVSHMIENQAGLNAIQKIVGHTNLSTIQNYASVSIKHLEKSYKMANKKW